MQPSELPKTPKDAYNFPPTDQLVDLREMIQQGFIDEEVAVAGRLVSRRRHGKLSFDTLRDETGELQIVSTQAQTLGYTALQGCQVGDVVGFVGTTGRTRTEEPSVFASDWAYLAKTQISFPDMSKGLTDPDARIRQRYLDLLVNPESRERFRKRGQVVRSIRQFMADNEFEEVETPAFHPIAGGASARPFTTHHNALNTDFYLRVAPELYLKRLIVGGFTRIFEIGKNFRNEGIDTTHNPEFTMMEVYGAYWDCENQIEFTEQLVESVVKDVNNGSPVISYQGETVDFSAPWRRATMAELASGVAGEPIDIDTDISQLQAICQRLNIEYVPEHGPGKLLSLIFEEAEQTLRQPIFVTEYPTEISPLAREHRSKPGYTERFEAFVVGTELCNGYTELNDPDIQLARFEEQEAMQGHDDEAMSIDLEYVQALRYGMPPTGGMGIGIDRLSMLVGDTASIRDVILFPSQRKLRG